MVAMEAIRQFFGYLFVALIILVFPLNDLVSQLGKGHVSVGCHQGTGASWARVFLAGRYVCRQQAAQQMVSMSMGMFVVLVKIIIVITH